MKQYKELVERILKDGVAKGDRTGTGTLSVFGHQMRFDLRDGFPLLTTKKVHLKSIIHELLWFLKGDTNIKYLNDNGVSIWDEWATEDGDLGPVYGAMWRSWPTNTPIDDNGDEFWKLDQIATLIDDLKNRPDSRRLIVSGWNPAVLPDESVPPHVNAANGLQALPPCHLLFQFWTRELTYEERCEWVEANEDRIDEIYYSRLSNCITTKQHATLLSEFNVPERGISCQLYQRSADTGLGVPFNIASYALFTMMVGKVVNMQPLEFVHTLGDAHIYNNHISQLKEQMTRACRPLPKMVIKDRGQGIDGFEFDDFEIVGYDPHPHIKMEISV